MQPCIRMHVHLCILIFICYYLFWVAPSLAPMNVVVDLINSSTVNISWDPPPPEHTNGIILYNVIHLAGLQDTLVQNITTSSNWALITDLHPYYNYSFQLAAVTISQGPFSDPQTFTTPEDGKHVCMCVCMCVCVCAHVCVCVCVCVCVDNTVC